MRTILKSTNIVLPDRVMDGYIVIENGKIAEITAHCPEGEIEDVGSAWVAAGFVDLHVHGGAGIDFGSCTAEQAARAADFHLQHGTTTILPTLTAAPIEQMERGIQAVGACMAQGLAQGCVAGVHLEGPYFSPQQCGAQNTEFITAPKQADYERLIAQYGDVIRRWSYAPERDEDAAFCRRLTEAGVLASAGHTDATYAQMEHAAENGCTMVTHLYSCTSSVTRKGGFRSGGVLEYALLQEDIFAEIIADGAHLPKELIRLVYKCKGRDRVLLVTDALSVAGTDAREGQLGGINYLIEDGVCKLRDRTAFAGSIATADRLVRTCVNAGISLVDSVYMASTVPARLLGLPKGQITVGYDADLVILDNELSVQAVYVKGLKQKGGAAATGCR